MAEPKEALQQLESAFKHYDSLASILLILSTTDERGESLYEALVKIEEYVATLADGRLQQLYNRVVEGHRNFMPQYKQVLGADYGAFVNRVVKLANEQAVAANEADILLKAALNLDAHQGIWGPKGWRPQEAAS